MLPLPSIAAVIWPTIQAHLPAPKKHPRGGGRRRIPGEVVLHALLFKTVTGASFELVADTFHISDRTLRRRYNEWTSLGVWALVHDEVLHAYDQVIGLDLGDLLTDTTKLKAFKDASFTSRNPTDLGKRGYKVCLLTDGHGVPLGVTLAPAARHDTQLLEPVLEAGASWLRPGAAVHADRGYVDRKNDARCVERGLVPRISPKAQKNRYTATAPSPPSREPLGRRWPVETMNELLKRNVQVTRLRVGDYDRALGWVLLATVLILVKRLLRWRHGWRSAN